MMDVADKENATSGRPTTSSDSEKAQIRQLAEELQLSRSALQEADLDRLVGDGDDALSPADSGFDSANSNLSLPRSVFEDTVEGSGSFDMDAYSVPGVGARPQAAAQRHAAATRCIALVCVITMCDPDGTRIAAPRSSSSCTASCRQHCSHSHARIDCARAAV